LTKTDSTGTRTYSWDFENRLTSVALPGTGGTVTFKYDPFGRRIWKAFTQNSTTTVTNYVYDDANAVEEVDSAGNLLGRSTQGAGIDEPLAEMRSGTSAFYDADGLGSITSLSSNAGSISNSYSYDAFGNGIGITGSFVNSYRYTARDYDPEIGLQYSRARYYDPTIGRFLNEDPTGFVDGVDFYRYVRNNVVNNTDPLGLTSYRGFPADKEAQMRNAVARAIERLKQQPCGGSCAGKDGPTIINILQQATFVYQPKQKKCGYTGLASGLGLRHTFGIGPAAFDPQACCLLESTAVHEVVHGMRHISDKRPDQVEKDCFNCITPE
jgi:RHS repeat-associated protein